MVIVYKSTVKHQQRAVSAVIRLGTAAGTGEPDRDAPCDLPPQIRAALIRWLSGDPGGVCKHGIINCPRCYGLTT